MVGVELKQKVAPYLRALLECNIIALNAGLTTIRLLPPFVITYQQLDQVVAALGEVLSIDSPWKRKLAKEEWERFRRSKQKDG